MGILSDEQKKEVDNVTGEPPFYKDPEFLYPFAGEVLGGYLPFRHGDVAGGTVGYMAADPDSELFNPLDWAKASGKSTADKIIGGGISAAGGKLVQRFPAIGQAKDKLGEYINIGLDKGGRAVKSLLEPAKTPPAPEDIYGDALKNALQGRELFPDEVDELGRRVLSDMPQEDLTPSMRTGGVTGGFLTGVEGWMAAHPLGRTMRRDLGNAAQSFRDMLPLRWGKSMTPQKFGRTTKEIIDDFETNAFRREDNIWDEIIDKGNDTFQARADAGQVLLDGPSTLDGDNYFGMLADETEEYLGTNIIDAAGRFSLPRSISASKPSTKRLFESVEDIGRYLTGQIDDQGFRSKELRDYFEVHEGNMPLIIDELRRRVGQDYAKYLKQGAEATSDKNVLGRLYATLTEAQGQFVPDRAGWESAKKAHREGRQMLKGVRQYTGDAKIKDLNTMMAQMSRDPDLAHNVFRVAKEMGHEDYAQAFGESLLFDMLDDSRTQGFKSFLNKWRALDPDVRDILQQGGLGERAFEVAAAMDRLKWANWVASQPRMGSLRAVLNVNTLPQLAGYLMTGAFAPGVYRLFVEQLPRIERELGVGDAATALSSAILKRLTNKAIAIQSNPFNYPEGQGFFTSEAQAETPAHPLGLSVQPSMEAPYPFVGGEQ